eukprot:5846398-Amphidinium_carterae.1
MPWYNFLQEGHMTPNSTSLSAPLQILCPPTGEGVIFSVAFDKTFGRIGGCGRLGFHSGLVTKTMQCTRPGVWEGVGGKIRFCTARSSAFVEPFLGELRPRC